MQGGFCGKEERDNRRSNWAQLGGCGHWRNSRKETIKENPGYSTIQTRNRVHARRISSNSERNLQRHRNG